MPLPLDPVAEHDEAVELIGFYTVDISLLAVNNGEDLTHRAPVETEPFHVLLGLDWDGRAHSNDIYSLKLVGQR